MALVAHLGDYAGLFGNAGHLAGFVDRVRHRFFAIDVLAHLHRPDRSRCVYMVGRSDGDGVDVLRFLVEHPAKILVDLRVRELLERSLGPVGVDVTERDDIFVLASVDIAGPAPADADAGDVELVARGVAPAPAENVRRNNCKCSSHSRGAAHKLTPGDAGVCVLVFHN